MRSFQIIVPATSANMGPGFDSIGVSLNRYLTLQIERNDTWELIQTSSLLPKVTHYKEHFIYQTIKQISELYDLELPPCKLTINSQIPLARGLGSSASAILASIELVNKIGDLHLTKNEKLELATGIEGHPDNVAPALFGGFVLSLQKEDHTIEVLQLQKIPLDVVTYIPSFELSTEQARSVLPSHYDRNVATLGSGISNMMIASLMMEDYERAGQFMEQDIFHEPFRKKLLPDYDMIRYEAKQNGAYGTIISGAGPTMISFVSPNKSKEITRRMAKVLPNYQVEALQIDYDGLRVL